MMRGFDDERFVAVLDGFTDGARRAVELAQTEAARLGHGQANTGHLLLGLMHEEGGVTVGVLAALNVAPEAVREGVESTGGRGEEGTLDRGPFTPRLARVVELAPREAARLGQEIVGEGHLLLGLVREANIVAVRVLSGLGASPADVRREALGRLRNPPSRTEEPRQRVDPREHEARPKDDRAASINAAQRTMPTTFRARVERLEVHVRCGVSDEERALPQTLYLDLQYVYEARPTDDVADVVDYGALVEEAASTLEDEEFGLLETGARRVGDAMLQRFPSIREIAVSVTKPRVPVARSVSGVSVRAVFRR